MRQVPLYKHQATERHNPGRLLGMGKDRPKHQQGRQGGVASTRQHGERPRAVRQGERPHDCDTRPARRLYAAEPEAAIYNTQKTR